MNSEMEEDILKKETGIEPFSYLPKEEEEKLFNAFSYEKYKPGQVILEQEISRVEKIYILSNGRAQFFYQVNREKILTGTMKPGDVFGGISILFNEGVSIRSLELTEPSTFITLKAEPFLKACESNKRFNDFFAKAFGRCMLNKAFASIIARQIKDREFSLPFFNRPIWSIFQPNLITCSIDTTIKDAALKMSKNNTSAILVKKDRASIDGIVTDADLREKTIAGSMDLSKPVSEIMTSPLDSISADCQVFEAFLSMEANDRRHLAVHGQMGHITGIIRQKDLISAQTNSTYLLIKRVNSARSIGQIENIHSRLEKMLLDPIKNGANPEYITRLISTFSDSIIERIISFSLEKMGPPPCKFVFLTMGSEGREEQTLISDQDNAIVFEDCETPADAKQYFDELAILICDQLHLAGYRYCDGNNMAKNPEWCQPLSKWKEYFNAWIRTSNPENLLHSSIFFDFRGTWGEMALADELKSFLLSSVGGWSGFLRNLTENTLYFKPPITRFGNFILESKGEKKDNLDIKIGMLPLIDFTRVYALKNGIAQSNTLTRLFRLYIRHALTKKEHTDIVRAYNFMMRLRFLNQITSIMDEKKQPDNFINPKNLSSLDQTLLKEIFRMTEKLQSKLGVEFTGTI